MWPGEIRAQQLRLQQRQQMLREDEDLRQREYEAQQRPLQLEHQGLINRTLTSTLEDLMRRRAEEAQAPEAARSLVQAYMPRAEAWNPAAEDIEPGLYDRTPARPAARTLEDIFQRGVTPEQYDLAERYRPATVRGLGLLTPEGAAEAGEKSEKNRADLGRRQRVEALREEAGSLDPAAADYRDQAAALAARIALTEGKTADWIKLVTKAEDPVEVLRRLQGVMGPSGSRQRLSMKMGDATVTYEPENPNHVRIDKMLRAKGYTPDDPEYDEQFFNALKMVPVTDVGVFGGSQVIPRKGQAAPPGGAPATAPTSPKPLVSVPDKPLAGDTAARIAGAEGARSAAQRLQGMAKSAVVGRYLGPFDQYRSTAKRAAPGAVLGEVPDEVVDLDQDIATLNNYFINLLSGAAVTQQEAERLKQQLPKKASRAPVFQREVDNTTQSLGMLETRVRMLALKGDERAKAIAERYGLMQGEGVPRGTPAPPDAKPLPAPDVSAPASEGQQIVQEAIRLTKEKYGPAAIFGNLAQEQRDAIVREIQAKRVRP